MVHDTDIPVAPGWAAQAVFISSTFSDMQAERDWLRTQVFPRLEEALRPRRQRLEPIDLRLGVDLVSLATEEERELRVLKVCLAEIERSRPFFIVLLGDRYGTVAAPSRLQAVTQEYQLEGDHTGKSITALEIDYGLLARPDQQRRCFIYMRKPLPYDTIPADVAATYSDAHATDAHAAERVARLDSLKRRLKEHHPELAGRIRDYAVGWDHEQQRIGNLKAWGRPRLRRLVEGDRRRDPRPGQCPAEDLGGAGALGAARVRRPAAARLHGPRGIARRPSAGRHGAGGAGRLGATALGHSRHRRPGRRQECANSRTAGPTAGPTRSDGAGQRRRWHAAGCRCKCNVAAFCR